MNGPLLLLLCGLVLCYVPMLFDAWKSLLCRCEDWGSGEHGLSYESSAAWIIVGVLFLACSAFGGS